MQVSTIFDIVMVTVIVFTTIKYFSKGFLASAVEFVGTIFAIGTSYKAQEIFTPQIFSKFLHGFLIEQTQDVVAKSDGFENIKTMIQEILNFLPQNLIDSMNITTFEGKLDVQTANLAQKIVTEVAEPLLMPLVGIIVFFVCFSLVKIMISFIVAALTNVNRVPIIGFANRFSGGVVGVLIGILYVVLILYAVWAFLALTGDKFEVINSVKLSNSIFYGNFISLNPF